MNIPTLNNILLGKRYIGIECFSLNNKENIAILLIEKKKKELVITKKDRVPYSETLPNKWDKNLPFFLIVNTNQVIQKEVPGIDHQDEKLLHKAFPNTNWEDFYFEIWRLKEKSLVAIGRKTYVDALLFNYQKQGISITGISLGICSIGEIIQYSKRNELSTNHQTISWCEETPIVVTNTTDLNTTYNINNLSIENGHLLAFSGILRLLFNKTANTGNLINYSYELHENYNQHSFFSKSLKIIIGVLLAILIINFFTFTHYYKLAQETSESLLLSKSSVEEVNKTKQRVLSKEQKVKNIITLTSSQSSLVINEITKRIPQSILLTELIYHPLEKKIKTEESVVAQGKKISLSGTTIDNVTFTHWIESIEKLKWIDQVVITRFGKNDLNQTEFSIKIVLK
jgi:type II secretory pathway pseudopilin PulG